MHFQRLSGAARVLSIKVARTLASGVVAAASLAPSATVAKTVEIAPGSFDAPDNVQVLDQSDEASPETGRHDGMIVFGPSGELPRAVFIFAYTPIKAGAPAVDNFDVAVKMGNPGNPSLTAKDARPFNFGEAQAGAWVGTLPSGMSVRSYVVSNNGYRMTVLLKGPARSPYTEMMDAFTSGLAHFRWAAPQAAPAAASAPARVDKAVAQPPGSSNHDDLLALLAADAPLSPDQLQRYLELALSRPASHGGLYKPGEEPQDWGTALGRLVFPDQKKFKSLEFWTAIQGGDHLKEVLKKNGVVVDRFHSSMILSGEPRKETTPLIVADVVAWYGAKLLGRTP